MIVTKIIRSWVKGPRKFRDGRFIFLDGFLWDTKEPAIMPTAFGKIAGVVELNPSGMYATPYGWKLQTLHHDAPGRQFADDRFEEMIDFLIETYMEKWNESTANGTPATEPAPNPE